MMQSFYERALKVKKLVYLPHIEPSCMSSLETLLNKKITVQDVMFQLLYAIKDLGGRLNMEPITDEEWQLYEGYFEK